MKFLSSFALLAVTLASVSAHTSLRFPLPRASPLNPNAAVKDFNCLTAPYNGGAGCPTKPFPCGGYPQDTKVTQVLTAGQVISAGFWNPNFPDGPKPGDEGRDQARHNGGLCEFSLSYDGGNTYTKIATYHGSCPDIFFDWKVKIPDNAPSCDNPGKCIFSWSWINAVGNREFYQNCADVKIVGTATKPLPIIDITRANLPGTFDIILTPPGDNPNNGNTKGSGPSQADTDANLALTIGGGGSGGSSGGKGNGGNNDPTTTKAPSPTTASSKPTNGSGDTPTSSSPIATPTQGNPDKSNGAACSDEGKDSCVDPGNSPAFATCDHGKVLLRSCVGGTVCQPDGDSIQCGRSSR